MKKVKIVLYVVLVVILSFSTYGQESSKEVVNKVTFEKLPVKVKKQVNSLKGYKITDSYYVIEDNEKVFKVVIDNGKTSFDLKMDKNGNILGREEDYL